MKSIPVIDPTSIGENIRQLRMERNMSVKALANHLGLVPSTVYKWECGENVPYVDNLLILSVLFEVPVDTILKGNRR